MTLDAATLDAATLDAAGCAVLPGGVEIHSHVAGAKVNCGRIMCPEDHSDHFRQRTDVTRAGCGYTVPTTFMTGYEYARLGYTTLFEAAVPPLTARHAHEELHDTGTLGDSGDVTGFNMRAGTIIVAGTPGARVGARMVRGTVILLGGDTMLLPTFCYDCTYQPDFWALLHRDLARQGFAPGAGPGTAFMHYSGDANEGGRGEVLVRA